MKKHPDEVLEEKYGETDADLLGLQALKTPEIPGFVVRWVRYRIRGEDDTGNIIKRFDIQGWKPVRGSEVSTKFRLGSTKFRDIEDCITFKDLILSKIPVARAERIRQAVRNLTDNLSRGDQNQIDRYRDSKMPVFDNSTHTTRRGQGAERDVAFQE